MAHKTTDPHDSLKKLLQVLACVSLVFLFSRCGSNPGANGPAVGTFSYIYTNLLHTACIECHVPTGAQNGATLDFTTQALAFQTLTASTVQGGASVGICATVKIVNPSSVTTSYLAAVLLPSYHTTNFGGVSGCTPYSVHLSDQHLTADEQSSIVTWIQNGAPNN